MTTKKLCCCGNPDCTFRINENPHTGVEPYNRFAYARPKTQNMIKRETVKVNQK